MRRITKANSRWSRPTPSCLLCFVDRDNRLTSLEGISGLPNLRELRLDINQLTSLHDLTMLPSLVELSANTNHITSLPAGFAAGLVRPGPLFSDLTDVFKTSGECTVALGGLQKLELYHNRISYVDPRALDGLVSLTHLDLGRNQLKRLNGRGMEACPALTTLVLSQNLLREPPSPLRLPLLSELWLSGNQIRSMADWAATPPPDVLSGIEGTRPKKKSPTVDVGRAAIDCRGVWLPSLEVLHLQDNLLETLGAWSLVGCPLLRFLDASFNRLRTPDDFHTCLQACGELEEVRLHDNPAVERADYAHIVALSCPQVSSHTR